MVSYEIVETQTQTVLTAEKLTKTSLHKMAQVLAKVLLYSLFLLILHYTPFYTNHFSSFIFTCFKILSFWEWKSSSVENFVDV